MLKQLTPFSDRQVFDKRLPFLTGPVLAIVNMIARPVSSWMNTLECQLRNSVFDRKGTFDLRISAPQLIWALDYVACLAGAR
jgi:hypothetical protein